MFCQRYIPIDDAVPTKEGVNKWFLGYFYIHQQNNHNE